VPGLEPFLAIAIGLGLAAAAGFRVFVPLLAASAAAHTGHLTLAPGFEWIGSMPALVAFGSATLLEVGAYYIPWLDHALDSVATPAAVAAGVVASASVLTDLPPLLKWTVALLGGGGVAGLTQGATVLLRLKSGLLTGGFGNALVATVELLGAAGTVILALTLPLLALVLVGILCVAAFRMMRRIRFGRRAAASAPDG
jgi:hypothetical protein